MLSFFRRALSSWLVLGLLGLIMVAFIVTGIGTPGGSLGKLGGGDASSSTLATVGGTALGEHEVTTRVQLALDAVRQQQPDVDMATFVRGGGFDETVGQLISAKALDIWGRKHGFAASDRLVGGDIANIAAFKGPTGQFDQKTFEAVLAQRKMSERQFREDIAGDAIRRQILVPIAGATNVPVGLVTPYANLLVEARNGTVGVVPAMVVPPGPTPADADTKSFYAANLSRYSMPERRVLRYAIFTKDQVKSVPAPTDAEIAAFYKANADSYGAHETRSFSQIVVPDQKVAVSVAAKVKGGANFAAAAQSAGFSASDIALGEKTQAQLAELTSPAVAAAAYAKPEGGTTDPVKSELGWHVIHVDAVKRASGKSLDQVKGEITASLSKQKTDEAIANMVNAVEDAISNGSTFDDVVKSEKLTALSSPPLTAQGQAPDNPGYQPPPELRVLLKPAFEAERNDAPTVENIGNGQLHAVLKVGTILPAAPIPFEKIKAQVTRDLLAQRASERAKAIATAILAKANAGTPLAQAIGESGIKLPPPQKIAARQIELMQSGKQVPPPLAMLFQLSPGKARLMPAPNNQGWLIVRLDSIDKGDASKTPGFVDATRGQFVRMIGQEYVEQFAKAAEREIGVKRNDAAIARLRTQLAGGNASDQ